MCASLKAVIFDFGNVLTLAPDPQGWEKMRELCGLSPEAFKAAYREHRRDYDRGSMGGREYWRRVTARSELGEPFSEDLIRQLISLDARSWTRMNGPLIAWAQLLRRQGLQTAILSNMPSDILRYINTRLDGLALFAVKIFSCEVGRIKPEPEIYALCLERLRAAAEECLFLDDSAENVAAAARLGIRSLQYRGLYDIASLCERYGLPPLLQESR